MKRPRMVKVFVDGDRVVVVGECLVAGSDDDGRVAVEELVETLKNVGVEVENSHRTNEAQYAFAETSQDPNETRALSA